ncbi:MAG: response regulator [Phycisphaerae bacterium]|nr:response regulator [Phycisphaerae bacterium]
MNICNECTHQPTVLCVDDEPYVLKALERELQRYGCRVLVADNGADALELLQEQRIEVLICDYAMPQMRGTEVLERAKTVSPETKRVLLSAHGCDPDVAIPAVNEGEIYRLLLKPWEEEEIRCVVADALGSEPPEWQQRQARVRERLGG